MATNGKIKMYKEVTETEEGFERIMAVTPSQQNAAEKVEELRKAGYTKVGFYQYQ